MTTKNKKTKKNTLSQSLSQSLHHARLDLSITHCLHFSIYIFSAGFEFEKLNCVIYQAKGFRFVNNATMQVSLESSSVTFA